jgi:hypothetical protein
MQHYADSCCTLPKPFAPRPQPPLLSEEVLEVLRDRSLSQCLTYILGIRGPEGVTIAGANADGELAVVMLMAARAGLLVGRHHQRSHRIGVPSYGLPRRHAMSAVQRIIQRLRREKTEYIFVWRIPGQPGVHLSRSPGLSNEQVDDGLCDMARDEVNLASGLS